MSEQSKLSAHQLMVISVFFTIGSAILVIPAVMAHFAKQDAWIAAVIGVGAGMLSVWIITAVGVQFPKRTLIEIIEAALGRWPGKIISLWLFGTIFLCSPSVVLFVLGNFMVTQMMPETPVQSLQILFALIVVMGARLGLETLARAAELLFPFFAVLYVLLVVSASPEIKIANLQPLFETDLASLGSASLFFMCTLNMPIVVLLMIFPSMSPPLRARKAIFTGSLIGSLAMAVIVLVTILVFGPDFTAGHFFPSYELAQKIRIAGFFQRFEVIIAFLWILSLYFRLTLYIYCTATAAAQIFRLKDHRPLILPIGMLLVVMPTLIFPNIAYEQTYELKTWIPYTLSVGLLLPLLLLIVHGLRKALVSR
ncbi:endospore germination permease [Cohnella faecalis]|uniref:Spore gernimation protein n=1 Tax=Cohnella faecalis TaxID=2315694 RepID=A0A398CRU4_9BACL|nr:endospore germination permease [Cohnella faecalis]RIE05273.1 spore gernimation protein [Cohnella faecalis]